MTPFGPPDGRPTRRALEQGGGSMLSGVVIRCELRYIPFVTVTSEHGFSGLAGQHCYAVKGDVLG